jgi:hypothetical protein
MTDVFLLVAPFVWAALVSCGVLIYVIRMNRKIEARLKWAEWSCERFCEGQDRFERSAKADLEVLLKELAQRRSAAGKAAYEKGRQRKLAQQLATKNSTST